MRCEHLLNLAAKLSLDGFQSAVRFILHESSSASYKDILRRVREFDNMLVNNI